MALEHLVAASLCGFAKLLTGVRAMWRQSIPDDRQRVYFANHRSHGDFLLIWAALPPRLQRRTRPVAGVDYWNANALRRYLAGRVFRSVLVDRSPHRHTADDPIAQMGAALASGESLIIFPEGTRNLGDGLLPFKGGIYRLAQAHPEAELVPVWIENLGRVIPKGAVIPIPLLCSLTFGEAMHLQPGEGKGAFLARARDALLALAPAAE